MSLTVTSPSAATYAVASQGAGTIAAYRSAWTGFIEWCGERGRPSLPTTDDALADYIALRALIVAICLWRTWRPRVRRSRSPISKITPLMLRKIAAARGLANRTRSLCSKRTPAIPTGIVASARMNRSR